MLTGALVAELDPIVLIFVLFLLANLMGKSIFIAETFGFKERYPTEMPEFIQDVKKSV